MISARSISGPKTAAAALAVGLLLSGCYYPYGYPAYPSYPVTSAIYTQREFVVPASGAAVATSPATLPPQYEYAVGSPYSDYYQTYPYPYPYYPYAGYPAYYGYGYPAVSFGFGYWGGRGCCWGGHGWHGGGWHGGGGGWHGGGGGWHGGGSGWHGGGGGGHGH